MCAMLLPSKFANTEGSPVLQAHSIVLVNQPKPTVARKTCAGALRRSWRCTGRCCRRRKLASRRGRMLCGTRQQGPGNGCTAAAAHAKEAAQTSAGMSRATLPSHCRMMPDSDADARNLLVMVVILL